MMCFVFHIMKYYEIKLHYGGLYSAWLYSVFIQFMGLFVANAKIAAIKTKKPIEISLLAFNMLKGLGYSLRLIAALDTLGSDTNSIVSMQ